jgi:hypothetical protein
VAVVVVFALLAVGAAKYSFHKREIQKIDPNSYQLVQIAGTQSYIGHLKFSGHGKDAVLSDVYYVQQTPAATDTKNAATDPGFALRKLGGEIHGPEDIMHLNWQNVLFWENLKADSKVVQGIAQDKASRGVK